MNFVKSVSLALIGIASFVTPAWCQQAPGPIRTTPEWRGYIAALAGAVNGPPSEPAFTVEYGENMRRDAQAYVALSYFDNLMRQQTRTDLAAVGATLTAITGTPWRLTGRDRGVAATGGAKYVAPLGVFRPYAGGGAGVINIKRTITDARYGDVKQAVFNDFLVGDPALVGIESSTKPVAEFVGGVGLIFGHTYVDAAYRYRKVFRITDLDFSQFSAGVGYKF
jgi:opacity protein-like surface antigen